MQTLPHNDEGDLMGKLIPVERLGRTDAVLSSECNQQLCRVEEEYRARDHITHHGMKPKKRLLFYGGPGNGKSFSARRLAKSTRLPLMIVPCSMLVSHFIGQSGRNVAKLFEFASKTPCVMLIDEADAIGSARLEGASSGGTNEINRMVNSLLQSIEIWEPAGLVILTTNFQQSLDHALFRRLDALIRFDNPDDDARRKIIRQTVGKMAPKSFSLDEVVVQSEGLSAALLVSACQEAMKTAILNGARVVTLQSINTEIRRTRIAQKDLRVL